MNFNGFKFLFLFTSRFFYMLLVIGFLTFATESSFASVYTYPTYYPESTPPIPAPPEYLLNCHGCPITDDKLREQLAAQGVEIIETGDKLEIILGVDRFFMPRSNTRLQYNKVETMKLVTRFLKTRGYVPIEVYGHTDNVGSDRSKLRRTKEQADTIAAYLWSNGIPLGNIKSVGCGDTEPVASNQTADGSAANRRIEIFTGYN